MGASAFAAAVPVGSVAVLCGLETHVCVAQTALDLLASGRDVAVVVDAVTSRHAIDHEVALRRLEQAGAVLTTSEAVLFEWTRTAEHPRFQDVRQLVR
jgi:nicotinamidase-related amidase